MPSARFGAGGEAREVQTADPDQQSTSTATSPSPSPLNSARSNSSLDYESGVGVGVAIPKDPPQRATTFDLINTGQDGIPTGATNRFDDVCCMAWSIPDLDEQTVLPLHMEVSRQARLAGVEVLESSATSGLVLCRSRLGQRGIEPLNAEDIAVGLGQNLCRYAVAHVPAYKIQVGVHTGPLSVIGSSGRRGYKGEGAEVARNLAAAGFDKHSTVHYSAEVRPRLRLLGGLASVASKDRKSFYLNPETEIYSSSRAAQRPPCPGCDDFFTERVVATAEAAIPVLKKCAGSALALEANSIYGAAIALPQIAQSVGWQRFFTLIAVRMYVLLIINVTVQSLLLSFIAQAKGYDQLAGRPHLCDFAKVLDECPEAGSTCRGPGGTIFTPPRMYAFAVWSMRTYILQAFRDVYPDVAEIEKSVDPGEYGMESHHCRILGCFLFTMSLVLELRSIIQLTRVLLHVPTCRESWVSCVAASEADGKAEYFAQGLVKLRVAGMTRGWKVTNAILVLLPKALLWFTCLTEGFVFLMETAGIVDVIFGCMAMSFILDIDKFLLEVAKSDATRCIMDSLEDLEVAFDPDCRATGSDADIYLHYVKQNLKIQRCKRPEYFGLFRSTVSFNLLLTLAMWGSMLFHYYAVNCYQKDGLMVSNDVEVPMHHRFQWVDFLYELMYDVEPGEPVYTWRLP